MGLAGQQPGKLMVSDVIDLPGVFQDGRHVGGDIGLPVGDTDDHGAFLPGNPNFTGVVLEHQLQSVGAANTDHGLGNGVNGTDFVFFIVVVHQLDYHLGIGLTVKLVAMLEKLLLQFRVVFNNSVVDAHHLGLHLPGSGAGAVAGHMGMGVDLRGHAVGSPAGVSDAAGAGQGTAVIGLLRQIFQPPRGLHHLGKLTAVPDSQSSGVIAPVFQLAQAVQQNGRRLFLSGESYNTAHKQPLSRP